MLNNKIKDVATENKDSYEFDNQSRLIIIGLFGLGVLLNFVIKYFESIYVFTLIAYSAITFTGIIIANQLRLQDIKNRRDDIVEVYTTLDKILKTKPEDIDFNNTPFELVYSKQDKKKIEAIEVVIDNPAVFNDGNLTDAVYRLNQYMNYFQWVQIVDFPGRKCTFKGKKKPPDYAGWNGSDLRPWNWIPLGIGSNGEVAWNLGASKDAMGRSLFRYEDTGEIAGTTEISKAPQSLTLGSTGGGKAIQIDQIVRVK